MKAKAYLKVTNTNTKCTQNCDVVPIKGSPERSTRSIQISEEAAKEIESLMYKDYSHKGKPSHRPPINNHQPNNP